MNKTAPPPPEYKSGCKAADSAAQKIEESADRVAQNIQQKRSSGRWDPPVLKRQPSDPGLLLRCGLVGVARLYSLTRETRGRREVGEPRRVDPAEHAPSLAGTPGGVELRQAGLHIDAR